MNISQADLEYELRRFGKHHVEQVRAIVAHQHHPGVTLSLILAVGSRETNLINEVGDLGHGRSWLQIDDRSHAAWLKAHEGCHTGTWTPVHGHTALDAGYCPTLTASTICAIGLLHQAIGFAHGAGVPSEHALAFAIAAYNGGEGGALSGWRNHGDVDHNTTGGDYSADVLGRSHAIHHLLTEWKWI